MFRLKRIKKRKQRCVAEPVAGKGLYTLGSFGRKQEVLLGDVLHEEVAKVNFDVKDRFITIADLVDVLIGTHEVPMSTEATCSKR